MKMIKTQRQASFLIRTIWKFHFLGSILHGNFQGLSGMSIYLERKEIYDLFAIENMSIWKENTSSFYVSEMSMKLAEQSGKLDEVYRKFLIKQLHIYKHQKVFSRCAQKVRRKPFSLIYFSSKNVSSGGGRLEPSEIGKFL